MASATAEAPVIQRTETVQVPAQGQFTVSLLQVDNRRYPNYRKTLREEHALDLFKKIKVHGQLQPCVGCWSEDGSKVYLYGGYSRFEVLQRIALEKLVREYNETMKKQAGDEGFIPLGGEGFGSQAIREKIRDAGPEWKAKYDAALASQKIDFKLTPVEDDADAAIKGLVSNSYERPPLMDWCAQVEALCAKAGVTAGDIAKDLKESDAAVSTYRKIFRFPQFLKEMFEKADFAKELGLAKPEEQAVERGILMTAIGEFVRRLSLPEEDPKAISKSHAKELVNLVDNKKDPLSVAGTARLLKKLTRINQAGNPTDQSPPDLTDFRVEMSDAKKVGKLEAAPEAAAAPAASAAPAPVTLATLSKEQQEQIDKATAAVAAAPVVSSGKTDAAPTVVTPNAPPVVALSDEERAKQDALKAANQGVVPDGGEAEQVDLDEMVPTGDELARLANTDEAGVATSPPLPTGQLASKPKDAPPSTRYNMKAPEKVERMARDLVASAGDGSSHTTLMDQGAFLFGAVQMFDIIGLEAECDACNEAYANLLEGSSAYIAALEAFVASKASDAEKAGIQAARPTYVNPLAAKAAAA